MHPAFSLQYFRHILVCLEGNEKLATWQREHDDFDASLTTGTSPTCSNMSSVLSNKTSSPYLTAPMPSIFMAASKHRLKVTKLQPKILMGKLSYATLVNLESHTSACPLPLLNQWPLGWWWINLTDKSFILQLVTSLILLQIQLYMRMDCQQSGDGTERVLTSYLQQLLKTPCFRVFKFIKQHH